MQRIRPPKYISQCPRCRRFLTMTHIISGECKSCYLPIPEEVISAFINKAEEE